VPALTITSSRRLAPSAPSAAYLWWVCSGLQETYAWPPGRVAEYLLPFPGVAAHWPADRLRDLAADAAGDATGGHVAPPPRPGPFAGDQEAGVSTFTTADARLVQSAVTSTVR